MSNAIRVFIADDSPSVCRLLASYFKTASGFEVVGTAGDGKSAVKMIKKLKPDVVTLDMEMPIMSGREALEVVMRECPTPVVVVSGVSRQSALATLSALEAGAVDFILKYTPGIDTNPEWLREEILAKVRAASRIRVVRSVQTRRTRRKTVEFPIPIPPPSPVPVAEPVKEKTVWLPGGVVVVGASTGGPVALRELLSELPREFPAAVLVVQHMPANFTKVLAAQLDRSVPMRVREAETGDRLEPGLALIAPGGFHMLVGSDSRIRLTEGPEVEGHRPSVDVTMQSATQLYGSRVKGVILTGMGRDGRMGMLSVRSKGGKTFAQTGETCIVNGMPQAAVDLGVVDRVAPPRDIGRLLVESVMGRGDATPLSQATA